MAPNFTYQTIDEKQAALQVQKTIYQDLIAAHQAKIDGYQDQIDLIDTRLADLTVGENIIEANL